MQAVVDQVRLQQLLEPFDLNLNTIQTEQVLSYLHLLQRWNQKVNLTAIRDPEEGVRRHFGESIFIARHVQFHGELLDIGSGAGFPGLALKIVCPELSATLLEPIAKKRAFLKEAVRTCGFHGVAVRPERLEDFLLAAPGPKFDFITSRAVGDQGNLIQLATRCLRPQGSLCLWTTNAQAIGFGVLEPRLTWVEPIPIPQSRVGVICRGVMPG